MEALILYFVLFFPGVFTSSMAVTSAPAEAIPFSIIREFGRTITYTIPSLALLWYLITDKKGFSALKPSAGAGSDQASTAAIEIPRLKRDIYAFAAAVPGLIFIGLGVSALSFFFSQRFDLQIPPKIEGPANAAGWIALVFSCLGTGYLEESYFRYYLLTRLEKQLPRLTLRIILSTLMFAACHAYEGPWGVINALLAGALLSMLFLRGKSLHGIAWAHAAYNFFVYAVS